MDKITNYRQYIQEFLTEKSQEKSSIKDIETEVVFDTINDRYLLIDLGWEHYKRYYNCVIHLEIKNGKIWIQRNQTDQIIADQLIAKGVEKNDIVLGVQYPEIREYTGYGVA